MINFNNFFKKSKPVFKVVPFSKITQKYKPTQLYLDKIDMLEQLNLLPFVGFITHNIVYLLNSHISYLFKIESNLISKNRKRIYSSCFDFWIILYIKIKQKFESEIHGNDISSFLKSTLHYYFKEFLKDDINFCEEFGYKGIGEAFIKRYWFYEKFLKKFDLINEENLESLFEEFYTYIIEFPMKNIENTDKINLKIMSMSIYSDNLSDLIMGREVHIKSFSNIYNETITIFDKVLDAILIELDANDGSITYEILSKRLNTKLKE